MWSRVSKRLDFSTAILTLGFQFTAIIWCL